MVNQENIAAFTPRRIGMSPSVRRIVAGLFVASLGLSCYIGGSLLAGYRKQDKPVMKRTASFTINGGGVDRTGIPLFAGVGEAPINLLVSDIGRATSDRRLQVFVAVYERPELDKYRLGKLLKTVTNPTVMATPRDRSNELPFDVAIKLPPGDYLAYVALCDIDIPMTEKQRKLKSFPAVEEFPGRPMAAMTVALHVD
ncbi:MAG: hypothetical protein U0800_25855 [Isosphaeraceae bacterium]